MRTQLCALCFWKLSALWQYDLWYWKKKPTRSIVPPFFGYSADAVKEEVEQLSDQLTGRMPEEVKPEFDKAQKVHYFLPVLRKHMRFGSFPITYRKNLMGLLAKLVSIPTSTAEVEKEIFYLLCYQNTTQKSYNDRASKQILKICQPSTIVIWKLHLKDWYKWSRQAVTVWLFEIF